jgi:ABC-type polar amino acid transport system ATPase subunit
MIDIDNLTVKIKESILLNSISCKLKPGKIISFIGTSGAGKTTLLKTLAGLIPVTEGQVLINNRQLTELNNKERSEIIGFVFQDFNLFPNLTVLQNCVNPLMIHGKSYNEAQVKAMLKLKELNMQLHANKYPHELSGGQKQRVAIARALCLDPKIIVLDEPTASLDPFNTDTLVSILQSLSNKNLIVILSSQDMHFVNKVFDQVYLIDSGKIVEFCNTINKINFCPRINDFIRSSL